MAADTDDDPYANAISLPPTLSPTATVRPTPTLTPTATLTPTPVPPTATTRANGDVDACRADYLRIWLDWARIRLRIV